MDILDISLMIFLIVVLLIGLGYFIFMARDKNKDE